MSKTVRKNQDDCGCGKPLKITDKKSKLIRKGK